eukprot:NODE_2149_length_986_cov_279.767991.p2 GENE.NODE_2149_length_986_cov_279.767991~~NODE_2149_length_986_cov_279.767991.p2  ORF type:complete len:299 (+),score=126.38 NODE_2149_length_986_cov_279.767991:63-959(+)
MQQLLTALKRPVAVVNLDPANDELPYDCCINIRELVNVEDVMTELDLGPNGALVYAMEYIEVNLDWLVMRLRQHTADLAVPYVIFDCPGQIELYTHHDVMTRMTQQLTKALDFRFCAVHLVDSTLCVDAYRFISATLVALSAMIQLELPHVNVLSKMDLLLEHQDALPFRMDYYAGAADLSQLLRTLQTLDHPMSVKFKDFNALMAEVIEDYDLVSFEPLDVQDKEHALRVLARCDAANGHIMHAEKIHDPSDPLAGLRIFEMGVSEGTETMEEYLERYEERVHERMGLGAEDSDEEG